jgi:hypothetical protein
MVASIPLGKYALMTLYIFWLVVLFLNIWTLPHFLLSNSLYTDSVLRPGWNVHINWMCSIFILGQLLLASSKAQQLSIPFRCTKIFIFTNLAAASQRFGLFHPEAGGSMILYNVNILSIVPEYMNLHQHHCKNFRYHITSKLCIATNQ